MKPCLTYSLKALFIYLGFYVTFNTVQVISRRVVGRTEGNTYSLSGFCTVNCRPTASNYQLSHFRPCREPNPGLRGGRRECYHSATVATFGNFEKIWVTIQSVSLPSCVRPSFNIVLTTALLHINTPWLSSIPMVNNLLFVQCNNNIYIVYE